MSEIDEEPVEVEVEVEEEVLEDVEADEETEPDPEPEPEPEVEAEIELPSEAELLRLQMKQVRDEATMWKRNHDSLTGKLGPEIDKLRRELARQKAKPVDEEYDVEERRPRLVEDPRLSRLEELTAKIEAQERREKLGAVQEELQEFSRQYPLAEKLGEEMAPAVKARVQEIHQLIDSGVSSDVVKTTVRGILAEAYISAIETRRAATAPKREKQMAEIKKKKIMAGAPGASASQSTTKPAAKKLEELSEKELLAFGRKLGRKGF